MSIRLAYIDNKDKSKSDKHFPTIDTFTIQTSFTKSIRQELSLI